jgi:hypothetical protein
MASSIYCAAEAGHSIVPPNHRKDLSRNGSAMAPSMQRHELLIRVVSRMPHEDRWWCSARGVRRHPSTNFPSQATRTPAWIPATQESNTARTVIAMSALRWAVDRLPPPRRGTFASNEPVGSRGKWKGIFRKPREAKRPTMRMAGWSTRVRRDGRVVRAVQMLANGSDPSAQRTRCQRLEPWITRSFVHGEPEGGIANLVHPQCRLQG